MGIKRFAKKNSGSRYSGFLTPFFSVIFMTILSEYFPIIARPTIDPIPNPKYANPEIPCEKL
jgi:hypothetical protein